MASKLCGMLGLAMRAGRLTVGAEQVCLALPHGKIRLAVLSDGASDNTKKRLRTKCEFYGVDCITVSIDTEELGRLLGKGSATACVGVSDDGFAERIKQLASDAEG